MNIEDILKAAVEKKQRDQLNRDRAGLLDTIGKDITNALTPVLQEIAKKSSVSAEGVVEAVEAGIERGFKKLKLEPNVTVQSPDIYVPDIKVPPIPAPEVTVNFDASRIKVPNVIMPKEMDIKGWVSLMGVDLGHPLPVQLRDASGRPVNLLENLTTIIGGGGGGKHDFFTIKGFNQSAFAEIMNPDGRVKVEMPAGAAGLTDAELRAASVDVQQASGASWSVSVNDAFRTTVASALINSDDRLRVSLEPGGAGLTDAELRASSVPVVQVSGANWSVNVVSELPAGTQNIGDVDVATLPTAFNQGDTDVRTLRVIVAGDSITSVKATANSGVDIGDVDVLSLPLALNQGDAEVRTLRVIHAGNAAVSVSATQVTSPWVITKVTGATGTTAKVTIGADASTEIVPTASARKSIIITFEGTPTLYVATGAASSVNSLPLVANQVIGFDDYHGGLQGRLSDDGASAKGTVEVKFIEI